MSSKVLRGEAEVQIHPPAWQRADQQVAAAEAEPEPGEADQLRVEIAEMRSAVPGLLEQARAEARRAAETEAAARAEQAREEFARQMASTVSEFVSVRNAMRRQMEEDLVRLAVVVARRVVRRELTVDSTALAGIARAAVEQMEAREIHRIRVAARDTELVRKFLLDAGMPSQIQVMPDAALATGSLVFETTRGTVDASVDVQLDEIDRGLADVVRRSV